jgi:hypothetical protein
MKQLIGTKVKTHDNGYVGEVQNVEKLYVKPVYRFLRGIGVNEPYVAYAVEIDEAPKGWSTLIGRNDEDILNRYAV